ncbi:hypothetical protein AB6E22_20615 [Vibrio cyclitrophicus]
MEAYQGVLIAITTGAVTSIATVAALKVDVSWIKKVQGELKLQVLNIESRLNILEKKTPH